VALPVWLPAVDIKRVQLAPACHQTPQHGILTTPTSPLPLPLLHSCPCPTPSPIHPQA
jgi:hypothetical protein